MMETTYSEYRILIIDDDDLFRQYLTTLIGITFKSKIDEARNPKEAIKLIDQEIPSLIILDLEMPKMDGFSFLRLIRMEEKTKNIPVIICSALMKKELIMEIAKWNISDYVVKSIERKELAQKIKNVLDKL